ncbi:MAG: dephospho-CoA kinase [Clostridia bacterium]|nr:dephospho-CoA kinase [Clostridia bacterium]
MLVIGITGPTGAGKGEVSRIFASHGLPVIDADAIYHKLLIPPSECLNELVLQFGPEILQADGTLNRKQLGSLAFSSPESLALLNAVTHRFVMAEIRRRLEQYRAYGIHAAILDAPQLFEAGANADCNIIVAVLADPSLRLERIVRRDALEEDAALHRMSAQKSDEFFRAHADYVIENNGNVEQLLPAVRRILTEMGVWQE